MQLRLAERQDGGDGFDLKDDRTGDHDIRLEALGDPHLLVDQGYRHLPRERDARLAQFVTETAFIDRFEEPVRNSVCGA